MLTDSFQTVTLVLFIQDLSKIGSSNGTMIAILGNLSGFQRLQKDILAVHRIESGIMER